MNQNNILFQGDIKTKIFPATLEGNFATFNLVILIFLSILLISLIGLIIFLSLQPNFDKKQIVIPALSVIVFLTAGVLIGAYIYAPKSFSVSEQEIRINRLVSPISIPINTITQIRRGQNEDFSGSLRTFGNGGLFGAYGSFYSKAIGNYKLYATNNKNSVVIFAQKTYVLTPDHPEEFIKAVQLVLPR